MKTEGSKKSFDLSVMIKGLIIGTVVGAAVLFLLTMVCVGAVIKMETVPYGAVAPIVMVISCIGAFLGGYSGARVSKQNGLLLGAVSGTLLFLICNEASSFVTGTVIPIDGGFAAYSGV